MLKDADEVGDDGLDDVDGGGDGHVVEHVDGDVGDLGGGRDDMRGDDFGGDDGRVGRFGDDAGDEVGEYDVGDGVGDEVVGVGDCHNAAHDVDDYDVDGEFNDIGDGHFAVA